MKLFMLKSIFLAFLLFISVLFGMQQANNGIHNMKGFNDANFGGAFTVMESENGQLEAAVLGNNVSSHDLQKKKEQLEEMQAYNFFSSLGKSLANVMSIITEEIIKIVSNFIQDL